jgi:hypothetical protein
MKIKAQRTTRTVHNINRVAILDMVARLAELHHGEHSIACECLGGGEESIIFRVDFEDFSRWIIKVFKVEDKALPEFRWYEFAAGKTRVREPQFVHFSSDDYPFDAIGVQFAEGRSVNKYNHFFMPKKKREELKAQLVDAVLSLHKITAKKFGDIREQNINDWVTFYQGKISETTKKIAALESRGDFPRYYFKLIETGLIKLDMILDEPVEKPTLIHGGLSTKNIIFGERGLWLIDPTRPMFGDPEYDLFPLKNDKKLFEAVYASQKRSEKCLLKIALYDYEYLLFKFLQDGRIDVKELKRKGRALERLYKKYDLR